LAWFRGYVPIIYLWLLLLSKVDELKHSHRTPLELDYTKLEMSYMQRFGEYLEKTHSKLPGHLKNDRTSMNFVTLALQIDFLRSLGCFEPVQTIGKGRSFKECTINPWEDIMWYIAIYLPMKDVSIMYEAIHSLILRDFKNVPEDYCMQYHSWVTWLEKTQPDKVKVECEVVKGIRKLFQPIIRK